MADLRPPSTDPPHGSTGYVRPGRPARVSGHPPGQRPPAGPCVYEWPGTPPHTRGTGTTSRITAGHMCGGAFPKVAFRTA